MLGHFDRPLRYLLDYPNPSPNFRSQTLAQPSPAAGKAACKAALQRELGLPEDASVPLLGFIGRLDFQKGPDVVLEAVGDLAARGLQVQFRSGLGFCSGLWSALASWATSRRAGFRCALPLSLCAGCGIWVAA